VGIAFETIGREIREQDKIGGWTFLFNVEGQQANGRTRICLGYHEEYLRAFASCIVWRETRTSYDGCLE
jgi:hypothetical protein